MRRAFLTAVFLLFALPGVASAAQLIDRNASGVHIAVNAKGEALFTYHKGASLHHVLVWGAINALPPTQGARQVKFKLDFSGGWGTRHTLYWKHFGSTCGRYDGPALANVVAACKAPDGSYWAAQSWPQPLPDLGFTPWTPQMRANWLEVSHWSGEIAKLETGTNRAYGGRFHDVF